MLENSQMRENMLLQYADDIIKVEMGSLRSEMLRSVVRLRSHAISIRSLWLKMSSREMSVCD